MITPTPAQAKIRDHADPGLLIVAPAGCGKTEALALRVQGMLERGDVTAPKKILVVTFSNRARDNIRERLRAYVGAGALRDQVVVVNFHGLSARIFRAHANVIEMSADLAIPDHDIVGEACRKRELDFNLEARTKNALRDAKLEPRTDAEVDAFLVENFETNALEIERERIANGELSYDDLPRLAELILSNESVARLYRAHFGAVVVDEFQDLTPQQLRIVNMIGYGRTTYAGDLAQGIYGFTGARPAEVSAAIRAECSTVVTFAESHRSSPAVLAAVNSLSSLTTGVKLSAAAPDSWPGGGLFGVESFTDAKTEAIWMAELAQGILNRASSQRIGIMARTAGRRRFIEEILTERKIEFMRWDDGVLDTDTARMMRAMLSKFDVKGYERSDDKREYLRDVSGLDALVETDSRKNLAEALNWCQDLLREEISPSEIRSRIRVGNESTLLTLPGIHVLTGHVGKGQQFDWVLVVGAEDGVIPDFRQTTTEERAEEARVLSVMLSRARHGAIVGYADTVPTMAGKPLKRERSPFLQHLMTANPLRGQARREWLRAVDWEAIAVR